VNQVQTCQVASNNAKFASSILEKISKCHHSQLSRNVQCLSINPSLSHLASLSSDQCQSYFVLTKDLDVDNNCDFQHAHDEQNNACETTIVTSSPSIQQSINPPSGIKFGIHLHEILSSHCGVDLSLCDENTDTIEFHSTVQKTDFSDTKLHNRKELTTTLSNLYQFNEMKPHMHQVTISNGSVVLTVPVIDVKAVLMSRLHDPQRMGYENFALNYDVSLGSQHKLLQITMKFMWAIYGELLVIITAVMIQSHFCWVWSAL
jgi:hypothetical protein